MDNNDLMRKKYKDYAFQKLKDTRDRLDADYLRDVETGKDEDYLARAEARLHSYRVLIEGIELLRGMK
jgi:hypothetical protein